MHYAAVAGADPGRGDWAIAPPLKRMKVTLFTMTLYNSKNSILAIRPFLPFIALSQQCCEENFISLTVVNP